MRMWLKPVALLGLIASLAACSGSAKKERDPNEQMEVESKHDPDTTVNDHTRVRTGPEGKDPVNSGNIGGH